MVLAIFVIESDKGSGIDEKPQQGSLVIDCPVNLFGRLPRPSQRFALQSKRNRLPSPERDVENGILRIYAGFFRGPSERCLSESLLEGETALSSGDHESLVFGWVKFGLRHLPLHGISNAILHVASM